MAWTKGYSSVAGYIAGAVIAQEYDPDLMDANPDGFIDSGQYCKWSVSGNTYRSPYADLDNQIRWADISQDQLMFSIPFIKDGVYTYLNLFVHRGATAGAAEFSVNYTLSPTAGGEGRNIFLVTGQPEPDILHIERTTINDHAFLLFSTYRLGTYNYFWRSIYAVDMDAIEEAYGKPEGEDFSPEFGPASEEEGYTEGTFDDSSDTIAIPDVPTVGVSNIGFVNVYRPGVHSLTNLGLDLFPDFNPIEPYQPTGSDVADAIIDVANSIANMCQNIPNSIAMFANSQLINYIIDCHVIPVRPTTGDSEFIKIGYRTMSEAAERVTSDYVDFDCGTIEIAEYYNNFIDYAPYTQAKLFLPFVGFVPIEPELFQSGKLSVTYRFNIIDGSFMAFVVSSSSKSKLRNTVIGQFGGNACVHLPITGTNYSTMVSGVVGGTVGAAISLAGGNIGAAASDAVQAATAAPMLQSSNSYNSSTAFLGCRVPYLMIERSVSNFSEKYASEQGLPSNITVAFDGLRGFTKATNVHLDGITATDTEKDMIARLLADGVIF